MKSVPVFVGKKRMVRRSSRITWDHIYSIFLISSVGPELNGIKYVIHGLVEGWQPLMEMVFSDFCKIIFSNNLPLGNVYKRLIH